MNGRHAGQNRLVGKRGKMTKRRTCASQNGSRIKFSYMSMISISKPRVPKTLSVSSVDRRKGLYSNEGVYPNAYVPDRSHTCRCGFWVVKIEVGS